MGQGGGASGKGVKSFEMGLVAESSTFFTATLPQRGKRQDPFQVRVPVSVGVLEVAGLGFTVGRWQSYHTFGSRPGNNMSTAMKQSHNPFVNREGLTFNL